MQLTPDAIRAAFSAGLLVTACATPSGEEIEVAEGGYVEVSVPAGSAVAPFSETGRWTGETAMGTPVSVTAASTPVRPGPLSLRIRVENPEREALPLSVDVVAPAMPMHGITRFEAVAISPEEYLVEVELPMEGLWLVYVNLDIGVNAASFEVDVPASEGVRHGNHDSPPPKDQATTANYHQHS